MTLSPLRPSPFPLPDRPYLFLSAGELSGDVHGARLIEALREQAGELALVGLGGPNMRAAGMSLWADVLDRSAIGLWENLPNVLPMRRLMKRLHAAFRLHRPWAVVLIDYQGFNMRLAQLARQLSIPTIYYIAPQEWIWGIGGGPRRVAKGVDRLLAIFRREAEFYRELGANVTYIGHPLLDTVRAEDPSNARVALGLLGETVIGLMPGSRRQEILGLTAAMLGAAALLHRRLPAARFILPLADDRFAPEVQAAIARSGVPVQLVQGQSHRCMSAADVLLIASGTATLEAAIVGVPMVCCYRISYLTYYLAKWFVKFPYASLPNIVAQRFVIPELFQRDVNPQRLADEVWDLLQNRPRRAQMLLDLAEVKAELAPAGAVARAAGIILGELR